ncbi:uncharacterized protein LOC135117281 [Helicoverpa armigera]|uniref:uncharacterized protein LOC135117281 n=1 Tax=Helicoverpa armigera TaxID=29058 RepID=UPI003082B762
MSSAKLFDYLLIFENILGIYRNYDNQNKKVKCFIILQILVQTMYHLSVSSDAISFAIAMTTYLTSLIMPVHAGQMLRNEAMRTQRCLARLHNTILIDYNEAEPKLIKDFIRLVKKKPLEIKLLTNLPLGMYLLPLLTMFAVNYTIIVLQINHII